MADEEEHSIDDLDPTRDFSKDHSLEIEGETRQQVGPYHLLRRIGEGGMGEVWLAQQETPRRKVALKLIKRGLDTELVIARFEAERQALALMDHPGIAKVFDAGETEGGRPWFVMEYVKGQPLTDYCDQHRLSTRQRLELFLDVCRGVQHAHQRAVIHRDLKPSNVLVVEQDGRPVPKIIDFGIAKAINRELTERTLFTELGQILGTPEYMSPEQAAFFDADIDIRTDVYALGAILYELLVGAQLFDSKELRRAGLAEIHRRIREEEPAKPSTRVSTLGETLARVAALRRTDAGSLLRGLRGDLDWITMKALEKDRTRRYDSASDLLRDVERHLHDEPVLARPPELSYRARKFVRRHRLAVIAASLVVTALLAGVSVATWQAIEARRAERLAQVQAERADRQALTASRVSQFLMQLFRSGNPYRSNGEQTLDEILDRGLANIDELDGQPLVQSDLLLTLGDAMVATGRRDQGVQLIERAAGLREQVLDEGDPDLLYHRWFLHDRGEPGPIDQKWLALASAANNALADRSDVISRERRAEMLLSLAAGAFVFDRDLPTAIAYDMQALEIFEALERETGQRFQATPTAIENIGNLTARQGDLVAAKHWYDRGIAYTKVVFGTAHVRYAQSLGQMANLLRDMGRDEEAEQAALGAYETRLAALGTETDNVIYDLGVVISVYRDQGKLEQAERWARERLAVARRIDDGVGDALCTLADVLVARGELDEADPMLEEARADGSDQSFACQRARGLLLLARGDAAGGDALLTEAWEGLRAIKPVNASLRALAAEAERAQRQAGNTAGAAAWSERLASAQAALQEATAGSTVTSHG